MIDIRDALYIPGAGFGAYKTKDQSLGSAEADFAAFMEEVRAAQAQRKAEEAAKEAFIRADLTKEDIKELAASYDPSKMSSDEFSAFLDKLVEKGVLEQEELKYIGHQNDYVVVADGEGVGWDWKSQNEYFGQLFASSRVWTGSDTPWNSVKSAYYSTTHARGDDVLTWAKVMSLWKPLSGPGNYMKLENKRNDIFTVLANALDAMQRQRKD